MKVIRTNVCSAIMFLIVSQAHAAGSSGGISLGKAELDESCPAGVSCDYTDTGMKFFFGSDVSENFRIEGFWADLGRFDEVADFDGDGFLDSASLETGGFGISVIGLIPAGDRFDVFGKFGLFFWDADLSGSFSNFGSATFNDDNSDTMYGFGGRYRVSEQFSIRGEWESFAIDGFDGSLSTDINLLTVGAEMQF